jgi:hypothetical protein
MNETQKDTSTAATPKARRGAPIVDTLVGLGTTWAAYGLKIGKHALLASADALGKTAHALETLASEVEKKGEAPKSDTTAASSASA